MMSASRLPKAKENASSFPPTFLIACSVAVRRFDPPSFNNPFAPSLVYDASIRYLAISAPPKGRIIPTPLANRRCLGAREDVRLDLPYLLRAQQILERGHAKSGARAAEHDGRELIVHGFARIPQVRQRSRHDAQAVTPGTLRVVEEPAIMKRVRCRAHADGRRRRLRMPEGASGQRRCPSDGERQHPAVSGLDLAAIGRVELPV